MAAPRSSLSPSAGNGALTLTSADVAQLGAASAALLSPLAYPSVSVWRAVCRRQIATLLRADHSASILPLEGEELLQTDPAQESAQQAYAAYYHRLDTGFLVERQQRHIEVSHWSEHYDMAALVRSEIYNDFSKPHGLLDAVALSLDPVPGSPPAALLFYHAKESSPPFGQRGLQLLHLLLPSFKAGVAAVLRFGVQRGALGRTLDASGAALALCDGRGRAWHQTPALASVLAAEPAAERTRLGAAVASTAAAVCAVVARRAATADAAAASSGGTAVEVRTARGSRYRVSASLAPAALGLPGVAALVVVEGRSPAPPPTAADLVTRFGLTPREAEVALLLAEGHGAADVARAFGTSTHTVRRQVERVLRKLGVHSRAAVGAALRRVVD